MSSGAFAGFGAEPGPERDALYAARERLAAGTPWKAALEALLLRLEPDAAERLQQILREARGSWLGLLHATLGRALFLGDPLSGTVIALARAGFRVTVASDDPLRLAIARARAADQVTDHVSGQAPGGAGIAVVRADPLRLPFAHGSFDLAVVEGDARPAVTRAASAASRGELALVVENRLAYKRWRGRRGAFRVRTPLELVRDALDPRRPEATLAGYRRRVEHAGLVETRAFALYPHALDFALIAALDRGLPGGGPALYVGPKERENRLKILAYRLGALPLAAPSFAVLGARTTGTTRIERVLAQLAERIGEPLPRVRQWIASRGNTTIVQTAHAEGGADERGSAGRWTVHIPHQPAQTRQARRHLERLVDLRARVPGFPVPEPLFAGELEGLPVFCERRLSGLTAPQAVGRVDVLARTFADAARLLSMLVVDRATMDAALFDALVAEKVELVRRFAAVDSTLRWLDAARARAAERLIGAELPLVTYHADLRSKHVVIDAAGAVTGILDWGSSEARDLPYFDLLHLIVHERKQASGISAGEAWRLLSRPEARSAHERAALDDYAARVGLAPEVREALEELYPVLVAAMAERNWDYSRPRWLHASFGV